MNEFSDNLRSFEDWFYMNVETDKLFPVCESDSNIHPSIGIDVTRCKLTRLFHMPLSNTKSYGNVISNVLNRELDSETYR